MRLKNLKQKLVNGFSFATLILFIFPTPGFAQDVTYSEDVFVTASRLGSGIVGVSSTIITEEDIKRSPANTIQDLLSREAGVQVRSLFGSTAGSKDVVDMRGFGAAATSNTLILLNGRRLNDLDLSGVDFTAISKDTITRIEILRGGSGGVLYGDGAQGGVINIITKAATDLPDSFSFESAVGSYGYFEENILLRKTVGDVTAIFTGTAIDSKGYRDNNDLSQLNGRGEIRRHADWGSVYVNLAVDSQKLGLPGARNVTLVTSELETDRRGTSTPNDRAEQDGVTGIVGFNYNLSPDVELIVDGGVRYKNQRTATFSAFGAAFNSYVNSELMTYSFTPRANISNQIMGKPGELKLGFDLYHSKYDSERSVNEGDALERTYLLDQTSNSVYAQQTVHFTDETKAAFGGRLQHVSLSARDRFNPGVNVLAFPAATIPSLDNGEFDYALHFGLDHQLADNFGIFGRLSRSIRVPNVDERVGQGGADFDLKIQSSQDAEIGFKFNEGMLSLSSSAYYMRLRDEIHFLPTTFTNINLDKTERYGVENSASLQISDDVRLKGNLSYTRALFRGGANKGNDIPLVSRWTGGVGASWNIWGDAFVLDADVRFIGKRRMDNDQTNFQPQIPSHWVVDLKVGGKAQGLGNTANLSWSFGVENIFNEKYFNYAIASAATFGTYNAYPLPGRTVMGKLKIEF